MPRILDLTPGWPGGPEGHLRVLDISDDPEAIATERARFANRPVKDWPAAGWYDRAALIAAGLVPA